MQVAESSGRLNPQPATSPSAPVNSEDPITVDLIHANPCRREAFRRWTPDVLPEPLPLLPLTPFIVLCPDPRKRTRRIPLIHERITRHLPIDRNSTSQSANHHSRCANSSAHLTTEACLLFHRPGRTIDTTVLLFRIEIIRTAYRSSGSLGGLRDSGVDFRAQSCLVPNAFT